MTNTITATKAKNKFGELIRRVYTTREPVIVEKDGIAVVVVIPRVQFYEHRKSFLKDIDVAPESALPTPIQKDDSSTKTP